MRQREKGTDKRYGMRVQRKRDIHRQLAKMNKREGGDLERDILKLQERVDEMEWTAATSFCH